MSTIEQLERLEQQKADGLITEQQFNAEKQRLLKADGKPTTKIHLDDILDGVDSDQNLPLQSNPAAVAGMVIGIVGLLVLPLFLGIAALVLGIVGYNKDPRYFSGRNMAIAGIVLGAIDILWAVAILAYVAGR